jgi:hypothetical protein
MDGTVESRSDAFQAIGPTTVEERECYMQGLRAGVKMFSDMVPHLRRHGHTQEAYVLESLSKIASRKIEEFAEATLMP